MWYLKTTNEPVIVGGFGMVKKGTNKCIIKIAGSTSPYEMQKIPL